MPWKRLHTVARHLDDLPIAPHQLGVRAIDHFIDKRKRQAATNPEWAEIEARRHRSGRPGIMFLSDEDNLTWAHNAIQRRIEADITPSPWWLPYAHRLRNWQLARLVGDATWTAQRARRGWSDRDAWNAGHHLARIAGDMCNRLADTAHGCPGTDQYPTVESWQAALRLHAAHLTTYGYDNDTETTRLLNAWGDLVDNPDSDPADVTAASHRHRQRELAVWDDARISMHWIAEHLDTLWD
jgi:hypothetical protein